MDKINKIMGYVFLGFFIVFSIFIIIDSSITDSRVAREKAEEAKKRESYIQEAVKARDEEIKELSAKGELASKFSFRRVKLIRDGLQMEWGFSERSVKGSEDVLYYPHTRIILITGTVTNLSGKTLKELLIEFKCCDEWLEEKTAASATISNFKPGETRHFVADTYLPRGSEMGEKVLHALFKGFFKEFY